MSSRLPISPVEKTDTALSLISDVLGDWWKDDRRGWCAYCGIPMKQRCAAGKPVPPQMATRDHVIPRKHKGGLVTVPACRSCNSAKGTMSLPEFLMSAYFAEKRRHRHRHQWPVETLWMVTAFAALRRSRNGCRSAEGIRSGTPLADR